MTGFMVVANVRKQGAIGIFEVVKTKVIAADAENARYLAHLIFQDWELETRGLTVRGINDAPENGLMLLHELMAKTI